MPNIELIVILGQYAIDYHLPREPIDLISTTAQASKTHSKSIKVKSITVTQATVQWQQYWPKYIVLPHPSPRNNLWLKRNPEFERDMLPKLKMRIASLLHP